MSPGGVRRLSFCLVAACLVAQPSHAKDRRARRSLADLERALDRAVRSVSRPSASSVFGPTQATRAYEVPGVGVILVVPPRRLPTPPPSSVAEAPGNGSAHSATPASGHPGVRRDEQWDLALKAYQEQALAMHEAAAQAQRDAEQILSQMVRSADSHNAPTLPTMPSFPPPPWLEWVAHDGSRDSRAPEAVVADVQRGVIDALTTHAPESVGQDESVVAIVEFYTDEIVHPEAAPARTLTLKVSGKDLAALRRGEISASDLAKRVAVTQE
jgi:hypothetical protein